MLNIPKKKAALKPKVLPVSFSQNSLLDLDQLPVDIVKPLTKNLWGLAVAFLVHPKLDERRFSRALNNVYKRHDSIRAQFDGGPGQWQAIFDDNIKPSITTHQIGDVDDTEFQAVLHRLGYEYMPTVRSPMVLAHVLKCGERGDAVILRVHHLVTDGFGMAVLADDLMKNLFGLPVLGKPVSHLDFIQNFQQAEPKQRKINDAYWNEHFENLPPALNTGRLKNGLEATAMSYGIERAANSIFTLSKHDNETLTKRATQSGISLNSAIFGAYFHSLGELYDLESVPFISATARVDPRLDNFAGWATFDTSTIHKLDASSSFIEDGQQHMQNVANNFAHLPSKHAYFMSDLVIHAAKNGKSMRQFGIRVGRAEGREQKSPFAEGYQKGIGEPQKVGPFTITMLDVERPPFSGADIQCEIQKNNKQTQVIFRHDLDAFSFAEIENLALKLGNRLDVDLKKVNL